MTSKRVNSSYRPHSQGNPCQVIVRSLPVSEILTGSIDSQPYDVTFTQVDSPRGFTRIFILHENINATRVVTVSAEELGTMSKNNLKGLTL